MGLAKFHLDLDATGRPSAIVVNGEDVAGRVVAGQVSFAVNDVPRLTLRHLGEGSIEGEGIVQIERDPAGGDAALGSVVAAWLRELDPMQVWSLALEGGALAEHPAGAVLDYLANLAVQELGG